MPARSISSASILDSLRNYQGFLAEEWRALQAAPLSARKAMLVAALVDAQVDRLFAAHDSTGDLLAFRRDMAEQHPDLGLVMALCSRRGMDLVTEAVAVPIADYGGLSVADFMVSLYNDHSVQQLRLVLPDGSRRGMLEVLGGAMEGLARLNNPTR